MENNSITTHTNKNTNKGFSLVEIIIVIAIIAILSAALAPQLMKYIEKSRKSTDAQTCASIETCVNTALTDEKVWRDVADFWSVDKDLLMYVKKDPTSGKLFFKGIAPKGNFRKELEPMLVGLENPKQTGMNSYKIVIKRKTIKETDAAGKYNGQQSRTVISVICTVDAYDYNDDKQLIFK